MVQHLNILKSKLEELPNNIEAEQSVIGSILLSNEIFDEISLIVKNKYFYDPMHQKIFGAIEKLIFAGLLANPITLKNHFENEKDELNIPEYLVKITKFSTSSRQATEYSKLPLCNPDFIYLDGPDQYNIKKSSNNFSTAHPDLMPMVADILKMEYFLLPGTIILIDGRGANASFLRNNLERKWGYKYLEISDQHFFVLNDKPIGKLNKKQINFYNSK